MYFFDDGIVTQNYGPASGENGYDFHTGTDIVLDDGLVNSLTNGTVIKSSYNEGGWGNYVVVQNDSDQKYVLYAHLAEPSPYRANQTVSAGELIGIQGSTGNSTGDHLHIEVRDEWLSKDTAIDPQLYFTGSTTSTGGVDEFTTEERKAIASDFLEKVKETVSENLLKVLIIVFAVALIYAALTKGLLGG